MINRIIDGISKAINMEFGDEYEIYTETIEQGLKEPCFSIVCLNPTNGLFRQNIYFRKNQFCIHYFPATSYKKEESQEVTERLYNCLEYVEIEETAKNGTIKNKTRGTEMHAEYSEGVLNFLINYDMYVKKNKKAEMPKIEDYNYNTNIKEG